MIVDILLIENLLKQELGLGLEVPYHAVVVLRTDQLSKVFQDVVASPWIEAGLYTLQPLQLEEQRQELIKSLHMVDVYIEQSLQSLIALGEFIHCAIVNGVSSHVQILSGEDLPVA